MKKKKNIIIIIASILVVIAIGISLFFILNDKNKLTVIERNWINDNINTVQNINVVNNANIFGKDGIGVFYDFLNDFSKEYNLKINPITYSIGTTPSGISLGIKNELSDNDLLFYTDHYVLVSTNNDILSTEDDLSGKTIGVISTDLSNLTKYITNSSKVSFTSYETVDEMMEAFSKDINYVALPLLEYLDQILEKEYNIVYHFSDVKVYYTMQCDDSNLSKVLVKYYNNWKNNYDEYFNKAEFDTFTKSLNITDTEVDALRSIEYNYGFVNTSPYEVIMGGKYGGIVGVYLSKFSNFSGIDFNFVKYKNYNKFVSAIENEDIDLYFNYYNFTTGYNATNGVPVFYTVAARRDNSTVINSINSLIGETVYVQKNSLIYDYIKSISGIKVETYSNIKELSKLNKKDVYLVLDNNSFDYYKTDELDNYTERYTDKINKEYQFKVKTSSALYRLLNAYMDVLDSKEMTIDGLNNHFETVKSGSVLSKVAEYIIYLVLIAIIVILLIIRKSKKITIAKKIKRDDKLKFVDQLTSLKNRNFLNENIIAWSNNTIYPQAIIVVDLNKIQEINDLHGYNEGDKQIQAAANVLIKTQLDNSEILRTDGNEFVIYLVGYSQKQVTNYIHKLNKGLNKLPYDFGAEFGYSMILDDIKTIEDALNEAVEDMKKQKSDGSEKQTKK